MIGIDDKILLSNFPLKKMYIEWGVILSGPT